VNWSLGLSEGHKSQLHSPIGLFRQPLPFRVVRVFRGSTGFFQDDSSKNIFGGRVGFWRGVAHVEGEEILKPLTLELMKNHTWLVNWKIVLKLEAPQQRENPRTTESRVSRPGTSDVSPFGLPVTFGHLS
jgi:hypothetical protein